MSRVRNLASHAIEQHSSPNIGGAMSAHHGLVLHIAEGYYRGTIAWQKNPDQRYKDGTRVTTSSTWIVGREPGEWAQMVDTDTIAWCQGSGSRTWNSVELEGFAPAAPTAWQIEACAQLLVWLHRHDGVPLQIANHPGERGLGHHSMDREWLGENWGHDACPGAGVLGVKVQIVQRAKAIAAANTTTGGLIMFCRHGDKGPTVEAYQRLLLALDPKALPRFGPDADWGDETTAAGVRLVGGDGRTYGPAQYAALAVKLAAKHGGQPGPAGPQGPPGAAGAPGKTPTKVRIGETEAVVVAAQ